MYPDIFFAISQFCDFNTLISLKQTCNAAYNGVQLAHISRNKARKLDDDILKRLPHLRYLDCSGSQNITDLISSAYFGKTKSSLSELCSPSAKHEIAVGN